MNYIMPFFAGAFLCNAIPHLVAGLQGVPFPTPFAKPRGVGNSSPFVNFFWGGFNVCMGLYILSKYPVAFGVTPDCLALAVGVSVIGTYLSIHFGRVRRQNNISL